MRDTAQFVQQKYFSTLRIGFEPSVEIGSRAGIKVHCRQGEWDSACGLHCAAMALTLLGGLNGVGELFKRKNGSGAMLWRAGIESYFDGVDGASLRELINAAAPDVPAQEVSGTHRNLIGKALQALDNGQLVALNWCTKDRRYDHWVLAVGLEGIRHAVKFEETAMLCLDPSAPEPILSGYNGRLQLSAKRGLYVPYVTNQGLIFTVTVQEIVVIGRGSSEV